MEKGRNEETRSEIANTAVLLLLQTHLLGELATTAQVCLNHRQDFVEVRICIDPLHLPYKCVAPGVFVAISLTHSPFSRQEKERTRITSVELTYPPPSPASVESVTWKNARAGTSTTSRVLSVPLSHYLCLCLCVCVSLSVSLCLPSISLSLSRT